VRCPCADMVWLNHATSAGGARPCGIHRRIYRRTTTDRSIRSPARPRTLDRRSFKNNRSYWFHNLRSVTWECPGCAMGAFPSASWSNRWCRVRTSTASTWTSQVVERLAQPGLKPASVFCEARRDPLRFLTRDRPCYDVFFQRSIEHVDQSGNGHRPAIGRLAVSWPAYSHWKHPPWTSWNCPGIPGALLGGTNISPPHWNLFHGPRNLPFAHG